MIKGKHHKRVKDRLVMWGVPIEKPVRVHPKKEKLMVLAGVLDKMEKGVDEMIGCL
jgi:hypothetical protein